MQVQTLKNLSKIKFKGNREELAKYYGLNKTTLGRWLRRKDEEKTLVFDGEIYLFKKISLIKANPPRPGWYWFKGGWYSKRKQKPQKIDFKPLLKV